MKKFNYKNLDFKKMDGLIPAIIQDNFSKDILMLGFMNKEALVKTIKDKRVTFYSRTKKRLWQKGETSGNFLDVISISTDCDNDTLLIKVKMSGKTCHKGTYSCFSEIKNDSDFTFLKVLFELIKDRKKNLPKNSYTTSLFKKGIDAITQKVGEEAIEVVIAAKNESKKRLVEESCDLLYHMIVLFTEKKITINDLVGELKNRNVIK